MGHVTLGIDAIDAKAGDFLADMRSGFFAVLAADCLHELTAGGPGAEPEFLAARLAAEGALTEAGHGWWFGAFVDGQLAAQVGVVTDGSGLARYQNVETHPDARRQGLAGALVWHAGHALGSGAGTLVLERQP